MLFGVKCNFMRRCFRGLVIAIAVLGSLTMYGWAGTDDPWVEVQSPHFNLLTDAGEKPGRDLASQFEQFRSIFAQLFPDQAIKPSVPLQIIALKTSKQISQYSRLYQGKPIRSTGFCLRSSDRDYIVLDLGAWNRWETVIHEYAHLLLGDAAHNLPAWFNEGFAELYSTIHIDNKQATLGRPPQSIMEVLHSETLMPVTALFNVDHESAVYNEDNDPRSIFYAESWLVVHYLWEHNAMEQAARYFQLVRQNMPAPEAVKQAFGMEPAEFDRVLQKYSRSTIGMARVEIHHNTEPATLSSQAVSPLKARTVLAGLHAHQPDYRQQAVQELEEILEQDPENAAAHRDLGYTYYQNHDPEAALPHLEKAARMSPTDWRAHFFWAEMSAQKYDDALAPRIEQEARLVVQLNPEFADGYGLLGFALMVEHKNSAAIDAYEHALALKPSSEVYELNLAELYTLEGKLNQAKVLFLYLQNSGNVMISTAARSHLEMMGSQGGTGPSIHRNIRSSDPF